MAIKIETEFPGKSNAADANYPQGSHRDITTSGDGLGTPRTARGQNDTQGLLQKLLDVAGITPSGSPDTVLASDYFDGLMTVVSRPTLTVATMTAIVGVKAGQVFNVSGRLAENDGGGAFWVAITTGTTPGVDLPNTTDIVVGVVDPLISFVLRIVNSVNANAFGAAPSASASTNASAISAAHTKADTLKIPVTYIAGTYISDNFNKPSGLVFEGQGAKWSISSVLIDIPFNNQTNGEYTTHVSPTGSDTLNHGLSAASAYESIQHAVDSIPTNIKHRIIIKLANGVHTAGSRTTNPIPSASTPRIVRVLIDNKNINGRDMLVIEGNTTDKSLTTIQHNDVFSAVYVEETNGVVIKDVTLDYALNVGAVQSIFQHRRGDMRISDVKFLGNDFDGSTTIIAETGGFIEMAGVIDMSLVERGIVALDAVISFIGSAIIHDGGTSNAPRTFEAGNGGRIDIFSGTLTVTNVQRLVFAKDSFVLVSPASSTVTATGFILDADKTATIEARRIIATGAARGVDNKGGRVLINLCTFTDQTTSAVVSIDGGTVIIDDCSLIDTTNTKSVIDVESSTLIVKGDGDIDRGFRGIFAKNSIVQIDNQMNFLGNSTCIDARQCKLKLKGTSGNPITFGTYVNNALFLEGGSCSMTHITITQPASKTAVLASGCQIVNEGGVDIDGGFRGFDLEQNASLSAESTTGSDLTNMTEGANMRRGSQMNYRTSSMDFTGTGTPTVEDTAKSAHVTAF